MLDIYNFKQKLDLRLKYLEECDICEENKSLIRKFIDYCFISGLSLSRQLKYLNHLLELAKLLGKPFRKVSQREIAEPKRDRFHLYQIAYFACHFPK